MSNKITIPWPQHMLFITKPLSAIALVAMFGGIYLLFSSYIPNDPGEPISSERVQATILDVTTVESQGKYSGKSYLHVGEVALPDGDEFRIYFPTKPEIGSAIDVQVREFADGSRAVHLPGPDDY